MTIKLTEQLSRWIKSRGFFSWVTQGFSWANRGPAAQQSCPAAGGEKLGIRGEKAAAKYLKQKGYRIVAHSHRQRLGEIDLIAIDGNCVVFVEVKTWRSDALADPSEAVDRRKQERITRAALIYLKQKRLLDQPARFDVVSIVWPLERRQPSIRHFENAFEAVGSGQMYR